MLMTRIELTLSRDPDEDLQYLTAQLATRSTSPDIRVTVEGDMLVAVFPTSEFRKLADYISLWIMGGE